MGIAPHKASRNGNVRCEPGDKVSLCNPLQQFSAVLNSFSVRKEAPEKDYAIKMTQSWVFGHGQGNRHYTYPCFHYTADRTQQCSPLICFPFIASISHTENSLGIDFVASVQGLNHLKDAEDNGHSSLSEGVKHSRVPVQTLWIYEWVFFVFIYGCLV